MGQSRKITTENHCIDAFLVYINIQYVLYIIYIYMCIYIYVCVYIYMCIYVYIYMIIYIYIIYIIINLFLCTFAHIAPARSPSCHVAVKPQNER